jgi:hypothetical protein
MDEGVVKTHDDKIGGERKRILEGETGVTGYKKKKENVQPTIIIIRRR